MRICVISDSLTNTEPDNWSQLLAAQTGHEVVVEAHGGWTTRSYFKSKFDGIAFANVPDGVDLFILLLGSNNLFEARGGNEAAVIEACRGIEQIVAHVLPNSPEAGILLIAPTRIVLANVDPQTNMVDDRGMTDQTPHWLERLSDAYRELAQQRGWSYLTLLPVLEEADFIDVAHPGREGNRKMAQAVAAHLQADLAPRS